jgi:hypothetical protein
MGERLLQLLGRHHVFFEQKLAELYWHSGPEKT